MSLKRPLKIILTMLLIQPLCQTVLSEAYVPESDGVIIFTQLTPTPQKAQIQSVESTIKSAKKLLDEAALVGNEQNYDLAKRLLSSFIDSHNNNELFYLWAKVQQHEHQFDKANTWLEAILKDDQNHIPARLMAARIALIQNNPTKAKTHCKKLLKTTDMLTSSVCLFEAQGFGKQKNSLANSYKGLSALAKNHTIPESHQAWITMILADMAERLSQPMDSIFWLEQYPDFKNSSYLMAWADIHLKTNNNQIVLDKLSDIYESNKHNNKSVSDGLLLRLALAEKQDNTLSKQWFIKISERVQLRELRQDKTHANEMAQYYLFLNPDPKKALYWAEINWTHAKEFKDESLLKEAKQANNT